MADLQEDRERPDIASLAYEGEQDVLRLIDGTPDERKIAFAWIRRWMELAEYVRGTER